MAAEAAPSGRPAAAEPHRASPDTQPGQELPPRQAPAVSKQLERPLSLGVLFPLFLAPGVLSGFSHAQGARG